MVRAGKYEKNEIGVIEVWRIQEKQEVYGIW